MQYPDPTSEQLLLIGVAVIVPLVWAVTHHGRTRMITLMLWLPLWLFVARVVYMNRFPDAPLEVRVKWAIRVMGMDPLSFAWPLFVLLIYGLIWLFTIPRRRRNANAQAAAIRATPNVSVGFRAQPAGPPQTLPSLWRDEKSSEPEPLKRCLGCNRRIPVSAVRCPHCRYSIESPRPPERPAESKLTTPTFQKTCPECEMIIASWANHCPVCQYEFPVSTAEGEGPSPNGPTPAPETRSLPAVIAQIRLLGELRDDGLLTEEEFQEKKTELLSRI